MFSGGNLERRLLTCRKQYNIKMDFKGLGWEFVDWSHVAYDRDQ
jgi:hypothetical protein